MEYYTTLVNKFGVMTNSMTSRKLLQ